MKKQDLKNGMIVLMGDDRLRIVLGGTLMGIEGGGGIPMNSISEDLKYSSDRDIVKVYGVPERHIGATISWLGEERHVQRYCDLLWTRPVVTKLTIAEIEKKLCIEKLEIIEENDISDCF